MERLLFSRKFQLISLKNEKVFYCINATTPKTIIEPSVNGVIQEIESSNSDSMF